MKINKILLVFLCGLFLASTTPSLAASAAKQLAKGISLYNENKTDKAMDYFIDVLVNGNAEEVAEANRYVSLIHNRIGGIQTPVEVDINFKEGEVKSLENLADNSVLQAQHAAQAEAARLQAAREAAAAQAEAAQEAAAAQTAASQQAALDAVNAQQQALTQRIEAEKLAAQEQAQAQRQALLNQAATQHQAAIQQAEDVLAQDMTNQAIAGTVAADGLTQTAQDDWQAVADQTTAQLNASRNAMFTSASDGSAFTDLTSPQAIKARELYTAQKIASMTEAAMNRINDTHGVHLYMRDNRPDALEVDPDIIFDKNTFRPEALPLLNSIYELLALTQGSAYVILPPGSYTDDVTLPGIRQAMALNSYLINRGISQGKLHYNMGLVDEEPPARFANLHGLSIVFDYDAKLPTVMEKNEKDEKAPLLSMAVVPLCHAIDRSLGEAFAVDFSVLETVNPLDNWVLQVVQHCHDGKFYIVRQLEGFSPVYHQILFNGRKGIIGPELPCGKYTFVLTGTDLKGVKQTIRRRLVVKCADGVDMCGLKEKKTQATTVSTDLDYKAARLWKKPGRKMHTAQKAAVAQAASSATSSSTSTSTVTHTKTVNNTTIIQEDDGLDPYANMGSTGTSTVTTTSTNNWSTESAYPSADPLPMNNPYDMPYETEFN